MARVGITVTAPNLDQIPKTVNAIIWDIETVPDLQGFAAANYLTGVTERIAVMPAASDQNYLQTHGAGKSCGEQKRIVSQMQTRACGAQGGQPGRGDSTGKPQRKF
jgi:hypothetical protein